MARLEDSMSDGTDAIFVGIKGAVLAIDRGSGETLWQAELKGADFVNVTWQNGDLFAASRGRLYRLDPDTGAIHWRNDLRGMGWGIVTIAGASQVAPGAAREEDQRRARRGAAAAS
jgi:outer membrane protein assembly factor BamB